MTGFAISAGIEKMSDRASPLERLRVGLQAIAHQGQFCTWRLETSGDANDKPRKVPYVHGGYRLAGRFDSPELRAKLMTLEEAISECQRLGHHGVGLVFFPGCGVVGVDLDHCLDVNRKLTLTPYQRKALALLKDSAFTERSQSDTGVHAIALGNAQTVKANGELEIFGDKNFLALTGFGGRGIACNISEEVVATLLRLVAELKGQIKPALSGTPLAAGRSMDALNNDLTVHASNRGGQEPIDRVADALRFVNPDIDRDTWLKIIFAIRYGLGDTPEGFELADKWSRGALYERR